MVGDSDGQQQQATRTDDGSNSRAATMAGMAVTAGRAATVMAATEATAAKASKQQRH